MARDSERPDSIRERSVDRALARVRERYQAEVDQLIEAAHRVMPRDGDAGATVQEILAEAGLSTRAFYRHFRSKDELLLAMYERDAETSLRRLQGALGPARTAREALEVWIDEQLSLIYAPHRSRRTALFVGEAPRLNIAYPEELARIHDRILEPLVEVLRRGLEDGSFARTDPESDARSIQAVVWSIGRLRVRGRAPSLEREAAHAHVLRFCLPALGAKP